MNAIHEQQRMQLTVLSRLKAKAGVVSMAGKKFRLVSFEKANLAVGGEVVEVAVGFPWRDSENNEIEVLFWIEFSGVPTSMDYSVLLLAIVIACSTRARVAELGVALDGTPELNISSQILELWKDLHLNESELVRLTNFTPSIELPPANEVIGWKKRKYFERKASQ